MCSPSSNTITKGTSTNVALEVGPNKVFDSLRHMVAVAANASRVEFFNDSAGASGIQGDYQKPLPHLHQIPSVAVNANKAVIRSTDLAAVNVYAIADEFREAELVLTSQGGDHVIERIPLRKVMNLEGMRVEHTELGADGDGADQWALHLPAGGFYDLDQPFNFERGDKYGAEIRFQSGAAFPAEDAYDGKPLKLELELKAAVPAPTNE